jgi:transcriptional regulator with XRE-family HTH domain
MAQLPRETDSGEPFNLPPYVSARLRAGREQSGMSVRALARSVEVSPSFISQIENGKANPSVGTLLALATALDISLDELFADQRRSNGEPSAASPPSRGSSTHGLVLRAPERPSVDLAGGVRWERLTPTADPKVSFLYVTYGVGGASSPPDALMQHSGREFGVVIEGRLGAQVGAETYDLEPGDSIAFECSTPHRFWTIGELPAVVVWAIVGPAAD